MHPQNKFSNAQILNPKITMKSEMCDTLKVYCAQT